MSWSTDDGVVSEVHVDPIAIPSSVMIPLDGSRHADRGILPGKRIAQAFGLDVGVVEVVENASAADRSILDEAVRDEHLDWSEVAIGRDVAAALAAVAVERDAVVCMATQGHGRSDALMGPIPDGVLRRSETGVVLVGPGADVYEDMPIRRLVVAVDGTPSSVAVCDSAVGWAAHGDDLSVQFATVVETPVEPTPPDGVTARWFGPQGDEHAYIDQLVERFSAAGSGTEVCGAVVADPISPAGGLAHLLRDLPDTLLVIGMHGASGRSRLVPGSVASHIVAAVPVPVLIFPLHPPRPVTTPRSSVTRHRRSPRHQRPPLPTQQQGGGA